jgi:hypothetical protein
MGFWVLDASIQRGWPSCPQEFSFCSHYSRLFSSLWRVSGRVEMTLQTRRAGVTGSKPEAPYRVLNRELRLSRHPGRRSRSPTSRRQESLLCCCPLGSLQIQPAASRLESEHGARAVSGGRCARYRPEARRGGRLRPGRHLSPCVEVMRAAMTPAGFAERAARSIDRPRRKQAKARNYGCRHLLLPTPLFGCAGRAPSHARRNR